MLRERGSLLLVSPPHDLAASYAQCDPGARLAPSNGRSAARDHGTPFAIWLRMIKVAVLAGLFLAACAAPQSHTGADPVSNDEPTHSAAPREIAQAPGDAGVPGRDGGPTGPGRDAGPPPGGGIGSGSGVGSGRGSGTPSPSPTGPIKPAPTNPAPTGPTNPSPPPAPAAPGK